MYRRSSETMLFVHLIYTYIRRMTVFFISVCSMERGVERVVLFLDSSFALQWREYTTYRGTGNTMRASVPLFSDWRVLDFYFY